MRSWKESAVDTSAMLLPSPKLASRAAIPSLPRNRWTVPISSAISHLRRFGPNWRILSGSEGDSLVELHWCRLTNRFSIDA